MVFWLALSSCSMHTWEYPFEQLNFVLSEDGTYYMLCYSGTITEQTNLEIPANYNGLPVKQISDQAFYNCVGLEELTIPSSVDRINSGAFYGCSNIKTIYFEGSKDDWCNVEFSKNNDTRSTLHNKFLLKENGEYVEFKDCVYSEGTETLNGLAFLSFDKMENVTIPKTVKRIFANEFSNANNLKNVYYEGTIEDWCGIEFYSAKSNPLCKTQNFYYKENGEYLLLTEAKIPETIESLNQYVFYGYKNLLNAFIGSNVTDIKNNAFANCPKLYSVQFAKGTKIMRIDDTAFLDSPLVNYAVKDNGLYLGTESNPYHILLKIQNTKSFTSDENTVIVNGRVVEKCTEIEEIKINEGVTHIGDRAIFACENLKKVSLPTSLTTIDGEIIVGCRNIEPNIFEQMMFIGNDENPYVFLYDILFNNYYGRYDVPEGTKIIGVTAFKAAMIATRVTFPSTLTYIGNSAFSQKERMFLAELPDSVIHIGEKAFYNCKRVYSIRISENMTEIPKYAFTNCRDITELVIPDKIERIGAEAFSGTQRLKTLVIGSGVKKIESRCFMGCLVLEQIFYHGNKEDWEKISIENQGDEYFTRTPVYFFNDSVSGQNYWHYDEKGKPCVW